MVPPRVEPFRPPYYMTQERPPFLPPERPPFLPPLQPERPRYLPTERPPFLPPLPQVMPQVMPPFVPELKQGSTEPKNKTLEIAVEIEKGKVVEIPSETKINDEMGFLNKLGGGLKKLGAFTGKVLGGVASGGVLGGATAFVSNLGPAQKKPVEAFNKAVETKAQTATFLSKAMGENTLSTGGSGPKAQEKNNTIYYIIGGIIAFGVLVYAFLTGKKRK